MLSAGPGRATLRLVRTHCTARSRSCSGRTPDRPPRHWSSSPRSSPPESGPDSYAIGPGCLPVRSRRPTPRSPGCRRWGRPRSRPSPSKTRAPPGATVIAQGVDRGRAVGDVRERIAEVQHERVRRVDAVSSGDHSTAPSAGGAGGGRGSGARGRRRRHGGCQRRRPWPAAQPAAARPEHARHVGSRRLREGSGTPRVGSMWGWLVVVSARAV